MVRKRSSSTSPGKSGSAAISPLDELAASVGQLEGYARTARKHGFRLATHSFYGSKSWEELARARRSLLQLRYEYRFAADIDRHLVEIEAELERCNPTNEPTALLHSLERIKFLLKSDIAAAISLQTASKPAVGQVPTHRAEVDGDRDYGMVVGHVVPPKFLVAFSFAGEQRPFIRLVASEVEAALGPSTVFFDEWYEFYIAGHDADLRLQEIYGQRSELVVVCVSAQYGDSPGRAQSTRQSVHASCKNAAQATSGIAHGSCRSESETAMSKAFPATPSFPMFGAGALPMSPN